ncbi:hypothetical protein Sango_0477100 [Sesamum angolense]|uniref:Retrotransposon Copia-like N-terminal domain-containing protein n=1 Tax=Sesamum angolense TaxID=2727404 RepID=A0AAE1XCF9_9LAMI|nr:hypothetical protein Sango_0477100 [Sesamum angolense]
MELGEAAMVETTTSPKHQVHADCLQLQDSDHPTMILVTTPFNGGNYLIWSRLIRISLGAKMKLEFIDGKIPKPEKDSDEFGQWYRVDCMVRCWILNSMSKDIFESFVYANSARELWLELEGRFGQCSWLLLYQLQREIFTISQGNLSVLAYFTKIKRLWDELTCLMPIPNCTCGSTKAMEELTACNQLMQFLMGLNDVYDHVRTQILVMDPLPSVNKAYRMILLVEKQRQVNLGLKDESENSAMHVKTAVMRKEMVHNSGEGRKSQLDKKHLL